MCVGCYLFAAGIVPVSRGHDVLPYAPFHTTPLQPDGPPSRIGRVPKGIQGMFGSPGNFLAMVQRGYRPVYRPRSVDFTTLADGNGEIVQLVELIGPDGLAYTARYTMEHEADGSWRISGCQLLESRRLGA